MRGHRFDKQLQSVFIVLSGLSIVVGLAAVTVNYYLAQSQGRVLAESTAIIERTERVVLDADLAVALANQLATARTPDEATEIEGRLSSRIGRIEADIAAMGLFDANAADETNEVREVSNPVARMGETVRQLQTINASIQAREEQLAAAGLNLTDLASKQRDLARLRITAGIWEMYSTKGGTVRSGLDRLADVDLFAFERLGELSDAAAGLTRLVQWLGQAASAKDVSTWSAEFDAFLDLAKARTPFMPSGAARKAAEGELRILAAAQETGGLIDLQRARFSAMTELQTRFGSLQQTLTALSAAAMHGRTQVRARMQERVAAAGGQAVLLTAMLAAAVVLSLATGYMFWSRTRTRVVVRLNAVAERIVAVARGETVRPMAISGHDEIGRLEKSINILRRRAEEAARLRKSLEAAVLARTSDVVAEMQSANVARAEAEELGRAKTHFLARMSHEIRTPLNGLIGMLDLLVPGEPDPVRQSRLKAALTSARDLQSMTEDILTFSSGEDRPDSARLIPFDPASLVRDLAEHLRVLADASNLATVAEIPETLPPALIGDATRIRQVIVNLISNAVKYTPSGEVRLIVSHRPLARTKRHEIAFTVSDTGPGMTPEEVRDAFDIYGRTVDARRRGLPGVGLGLAIVRQLTDMIGGELRLSTHVGSGSSFTLVLTLEEALPTAMIETPDIRPLLNATRVLVVEDDLVSRLVARGYLERMGARVTEAASGEEAFAEARRSNFDAILIDLNLPGLNGREVAARILRNGARVALLTADPVPDDAESRARFHVDQVMRKPVSSRALADFLAEGAILPSGDTAVTTESVLRADIADMGREAVTEIVSAFVDDVTETVPRLLEDSDHDRQRRLAHRLKGAAANFVLHDFCTLLRRIEDGDIDALAALSEASVEAIRQLHSAADRAGLQVLMEERSNILPPDA
ncbi:ATP-binding protein [Mycoplana ramosa]|uniref:histidine kinase n=1 Tax=Mycoplana ramosa TaxID=40837 RepID=A0ABW3Z2V8_MYCRA